MEYHMTRGLSWIRFNFWHIAYNYRVAQKSKLLTQYNSLLFLSHPVSLWTSTYVPDVKIGRRM